MFYSFVSKNERSEFGGSAFLEIQYCKMPRKTKIKKIVAVRSMNSWCDDSLYISVGDLNDFLKEYECIFDCGIYNNLESGTVDPFGINYYGLESIEVIMSKILEVKPTDYEKLLEWLSAAKEYNGFYILGV